MNKITLSRLINFKLRIDFHIVNQIQIIIRSLSLTGCASKCRVLGPRHQDLEDTGLSPLRRVQARAGGLWSGNTRLSLVNGQTDLYLPLIGAG